MKTSFKKIALMAVVLCTLFAVLAVAAMAAETSGQFTKEVDLWPSGTGTAEFVWSYDATTTTLTLKGNDPAYDWQLKYFKENETFAAFLEEYGDSVKTVVVDHIDSEKTVNKLSGNLGDLGCKNVETFISVCNRWQSGWGTSFFKGVTTLKTINLAGKTTENCFDLSNAGSMGSTEQLVSAFAGCASVEKVIFPANHFATDGSPVTYVAENMFSGCTSLKTVEMGTWVTEIKSKAFANTALTSIHIPEGVTTIADDAFEGIETLEIIGSAGSAAQKFANAKGYTFTEYDPSTPWANVADGHNIQWKYNPETKTLFFKGTETTVLPAADYPIKWDNDSGWNVVDNGSAWSQYRTSVEHVELQQCVNLTTIQKAFFGSFPALKDVVLPKTVTTFASNAIFYGLKNLNAIAYDSADNLIENVLDLRTVTGSLCGEAFEGACVGKNLTIWLNAAANVPTAAFKGSKPNTVNFKVVKNSTSETSVDAVIAANTGWTKEYYTMTWAEYCTFNPIPDSVVLSGTYSGDYCSETWSFDKTTGVLTITQTKTSGWIQYEIPGGQFISSFNALKNYIKAIEFKGSSSKVYFADKGVSFSGLPYLESFTWESSVGQVNANAANDFNNNPMLKSFGHNADGVVYYTNAFVDGGGNGISFKNNTAITTIVVSGNVGNNVTAPFEGCTGVKFVEYTGTADKVSVLDGLFGDNAAFTGTIKVADADVKAAVEALGYTKVKAPTVLAKTGMSFVGYQTRVTNYNGLRSLFSFDLTSANEGLELVEFGALSAAATKESLVNALDVNEDGTITLPTGVIQSIVWQNGEVKSSTLSTSTETRIDFCVSIVRFTAHYDDAIYNVGYEIWKDSETGAYTLKLTKYTDTNTTSTYGNTVSIYDFTLDAIKDGVADATNAINWGVLEGKGAVKFTKDTDYDDTYKNIADGSEFGDTFAFLEVQLVDCFDGAAGMGTVSVFEDSDGNFVAIFKANGENKKVPQSQNWSGNHSQLSGATSTYYVNNGCANPYIEASKLWNKIKAIVVADAMELKAYSFETTAATQIAYAEGVRGMGNRTFANANSLSSVFPIADLTGASVTSNKVAGVADLSKSNVPSVYETFCNAWGIQYVRLPATFTTIGDKAFRSPAIKSVIVGDGKFEDGIMDFSVLSKLTIVDAGGNAPINSTLSNIAAIVIPSDTTIASSETSGAVIGDFRIMQSEFSQTIYDYAHKTAISSTGIKYTDFGGKEYTTNTQIEENNLRAEGWSTIIVA